MNADGYVAELALARRSRGAWMILEAAVDDEDVDGPGLLRVGGAAAKRMGELVEAERQEAGL